MLRVEDVLVILGGRRVLDGLSLVVPDGEVIAVLGPSGSGKSTLLRVVAGLQSPQAGQVFWEDVPLGGVPPHERGFGLMFQDYALFPHKTVAGNVAFGLRMAGLEGERLEDRVNEVLGWVGLGGYQQRAVSGLSGGEQQRVALARALAPAPRLLMLDEPLGSLDRILRDRLQPELRQLLKERGMTALYVTHDHDEAFAVADRLVLIRDGKVVQSGLPAEVWERPAGEWAARFLGFSNVFTAVLEDGLASTPWGQLRVAPGERGRRTLVLRPQGVRLARTSPAEGRSAEPDPVPARVLSRVFRGGRYLVEALLPDGSKLEAELEATREPAAGEKVLLEFDPAHVVVLPERAT